MTTDFEHNNQVVVYKL